MSNQDLLELVEESEIATLEIGEALAAGAAAVGQDGSHSRKKQARRYAGNKLPGASLISRLALVLEPLFSACYDLQMKCGGGVRVVRQRLQLAHWPRHAPPLRAVFISDLHYGPTTGRLAPRQAWRLARAAKPDVLLLGGDFLYATENGLPSLVAELQRWKLELPSAGVYTCLGNHDYVANTEALTTCLEAGAVRVLCNQAVTLPPPWDNIWLAGTDDMKFGDPRPDLALADVPPGACTIMLAHEPDICQFDILHRCGLTLCGHTHGGQICLPNGDPIYVPSRWSRQYSAGLYRRSGKWFFVSRGVGTVGVPLRLWAPPEIVVFDLGGRS
ncbi:MAG TPA: metallophosphoesterase [Abditibacteriaceae bacterium]|nr:metallophosphoesterase [Abditibacteriaceae bacterium]